MTRLCLASPRAALVFLFWLLQMECRRVACHSRASSLPAERTNIITASPIQILFPSLSHTHTYSEHSLFPNPSSKHTADTTHCWSLLPWIRFPEKYPKECFCTFFNASQEFLSLRVAVKIRSRRRGKKTGRDFFFLFSFLAKINTIVSAHPNYTRKWKPHHFEEVLFLAYFMAVPEAEGNRVKESRDIDKADSEQVDLFQMIHGAGTCWDLNNIQKNKLGFMMPSRSRFR